MEFLGAGVEHVGEGGGIRFLRGGVRLRQMALAGGVVDGDTGLDIVGVNGKAHALAAVLQRQGLHPNAPGHQLRALKVRCHPVEHVVAGLPDVRGHLVFKGQHPLYIQIPGAGDEVLLIGVFPRQLVADEVAAVVEVLAVHAVIFGQLPAAGLYLADGAPVLRGHQVPAHAGVGGAAAAQGVQGAVRFKRGPIQLAGVKVRLAAAHLRPGTAGIGGEGLLRGLGSIRGGERLGQVCTYRQAADQQRRQNAANEFHGTSFLEIRCGRDKTALYYAAWRRASAK